MSKVIAKTIRAIILAGVTMVVAGACQSTRPIWFIATPGYVEARVASSEEAIRAEYELQIEELQAELEEQQRAAEELSQLASIIEEVDASNKELQELAREVEQRLEALPNETLELLIEVLSEYLDE
ncbi:MAG: hypothetical protein ACOC8L_02525 [Spirochaetota bacterium]